ncbi:alpha/beta hydrolase-like protein [Pleomassaria siparia CBS 279.74]|uniref:Alpha/beta hydrolase-like protein n=1 Tax=Pleomassaria siparia CBS 279.74 TaxID=1314801 RepID=A0A6G1JT47_9PLEO|nr:alpha/beta hydrolase-like protein [Pleomassaria siparia CBS 279.74]
MSPTPGILYVTMQPDPRLPTPQFHDWYNNEHGPGRLRLPFCLNGFRYRASDLQSSSSSSSPRSGSSPSGGGSKEKPEWMAIYDIEDMEWLTKDVYTRLRKEPVQSQRERDTMKQISVDRRFYDAVSETRAEGWEGLDGVKREGEGNVMVATYASTEPGESDLESVKQLAGWRRTRVFVTSYLDIKDGKAKEWMTLHEFAPGVSTPASKADERQRTYELYYTFGPAPRDLASLASKDAIPAESTDGRTKTTPSHVSSSPAEQKKHPSISSYITTPDGVELPYTLTGSADPNAPLLVLINSILTTPSIWTSFTEHFLSISPEYRILSYATRGRSTLPAHSLSPVTVDTLAVDVVTLLDALRVPSAALVGVSLGGATALNAALTFPDRISAVVPCDTNSVAPAGNAKAWGDRIAMCEREAAVSGPNNDEPIVGQDLAEATVRRWFVAESYADPRLASNIEDVKQMVATNSLAGFRASVNALYQYDFRPRMKDFEGSAAFLVGAGDGVLPKTMREMADGLGDGVELKSIEGAGHLPMVERPSEVAEFVARFLG